MNTRLAKIGNDVYKCRHFYSMFCVAVFRIGKYFLRFGSGWAITYGFGRWNFCIN